MELFTSNMVREDTPTDNSHLFGIPVRTFYEPVQVYIEIEMSREKCFRLIEEGKFMPFQLANVNIRCR